MPPPPSPGLAITAGRSPSKRVEIMVRKKVERKEKEEDFDVGMRHSAMEFDAMDADRSRTLEFDEFSKLVREREVGIHSEESLRKRFDAISDGEGHVTVHSCKQRSASARRRSVATHLPHTYRTYRTPPCTARRLTTALVRRLSDSYPLQTS